MNLKTVVTVALVCGGLAFLGGCSSMKNGSTRDVASKVSDDPIDQEYVARINQEADHHFGFVIWINPPEKDKSHQASGN
jgi:hypothetical protein